MNPRKVAKSGLIPHGIKRFLSELLTVLAAWFPYNGTRVALNRMKGVKIGKNALISIGCFFDDSKPYLIEIGNNVTLAPYVAIFAHTPMSGIDRKLLAVGTPFAEEVGNVVIEDNVYVGAGTIILPNIRIGQNSIVGAGSVVTKNIEKNTTAAGVPAKTVRMSENNERDA